MISPVLPGTGRGTAIFSDRDTMTRDAAIVCDDVTPRVAIAAPVSDLDATGRERCSGHVPQPQHGRDAERGTDGEER